MTLRPALPGDRPLLEQWDARPHVRAAVGDGGFLDWEVELPRRVPWRELLIVEEDGRPVGFVQVIDAREEETHYWGDVEPGVRAIDTWIGAEADLARGIGTEAMTLVLDRCFADEAVHAVLVDPLAGNVAAQRFYARLGFEVVGPRLFGGDACVVMQLTRPRWRH